jgi:hypothetical protein
MSMIEERRKSERTDLDEMAYISASGSSTRCRIANMSDDGAAIDVHDASCIPNRFQLMTERDRIVRTCRIVWIKQNRIGVEFSALEERSPITHRERQFLQHLRGGEWRRAIYLPDSPKLISNLLGNGWIERRGNGSETAYRITPTGLAAKMTPVKL